MRGSGPMSRGLGLWSPGASCPLHQSRYFERVMADGCARARHGWVGPRDKRRRRPVRIFGAGPEHQRKLGNQSKEEVECRITFGLSS